MDEVLELRREREGWERSKGLWPGNQGIADEEVIECSPICREPRASPREHGQADDRSGRPLEATATK